MRHLAIDYGMRRVGLALSDPGGSLAFPHKIIQRTSNDALIKDLLQVIREERVEALVLGLPLGPEGEDTDISRQVRKLASRLAHHSGLPVHLVNERYSSATAKDRLLEAGIAPRKRKGELDCLAATVILQDHLNRPRPA